MDLPPFDLIPHVKVNPSFLTLYDQCVWHNFSKKPLRKKNFIPADKSHHGIVSDRSAAKIKKAIDWLLYIANDKQAFSNYSGKHFKFKLSFITLTLASKQQHSDNEIKSKCLNQFLIEARKKWNVHHYLWRAEPQKNGNIHFHILCDKFIPWSELRDVWNRIQNKLGYVEKYRDEKREFHKGGFQVREDLLEKWSYKKQIRAYRTGSQNDWNSPNSTDIHSVRFVSNLPAYLAKYCTKNQKGRPIEGQLWSLSESLSGIDAPSDVIYSELMEEIKTIFAKYSSDVHHHAYYSIAYIPVWKWSKLVKGNLLKLFNNYISSLNTFP